MARPPHPSVTLLAALLAAHPACAAGLTTIAAFPCANGGPKLPQAPLTRDPATGNLYGTTSAGGMANSNDNGNGTIFRLTPPPAGATEWGYQTISVFSQTTNGKNSGSLPVGPILYTNNKIFGATQYTAQSTCSAGCGEIYQTRIKTNTGTTIAVKYFKGLTDGAFPMGGLVADGKGNVFGTTFRGGDGTVGGNNPDGDGTVFEYTPAQPPKSRERTIYRFAPGAGSPAAPLAIDPAGDL